MPKTTTATTTEEVRRERTDRDRDLGSSVARSASDASSRLVRDTSRVIEAWSEAAAEYWVGSLRNVGDLVSDLTDAMDQRAERREAGEHDDRLGVDLVRGVTHLASDVTRSLNDAVHRSSQVLERSFDRFADVLDERSEDREGEVTARRRTTVKVEKTTTAEPVP